MIYRRPKMIYRTIYRMIYREYRSMVPYIKNGAKRAVFDPSWGRIVIFQRKRTSCESRNQESVRIIKRIGFQSIVRFE